MNSRLSLVFYCIEESRYSLYALAGAVESREGLRDLPMHFPRDERDLLRQLDAIAAAGRRAVVAVSFPTALREPIARLMGSCELRVASCELGVEGGKWKVEGAKSVCGALGDGTGFPLFIAGGPHPTALPEDALSLGFDLVAIGEGEATFVDLLERIGTDQDWRSVPGIAYLDAEGRCVVNPPRAPIDLNDYTPSPTRLGRFGHIEIARGCPFGCAFCQVSHIHGRRPRYRSIDSIVRYVEVMRRSRMRDARFIAPDAFAYGSPDGRRVNLDALEELLRRVREAAGPDARVYFGTFPSEVRPEHVTDEALALVRRYADNDQIIVGAQAGTDRLLESCARGHTMEDVTAAVRRIRAAGLGASVDFIFGLPGETEDDRRETVCVMAGLAAMGARIHAHTFMPLPQTPFASCAAGQVDDVFRRAVDDMIPAGSLYGNWEKQEGLAQVFRRFGRSDGGGSRRGLARIDEE